MLFFQFIVLPHNYLLRNCYLQQLIESMMGEAMMLSFTASKYKNGGTAGPKSGVDMQGGMAVIKKDLGGMRVRINVLGGMAVICRKCKSALYHQ
jgi:hypothetical protein